MISIKNKFSILIIPILSLVVALIPAMFLFSPYLRGYIFSTYRASAIFNTAILTIYSIGAFVSFYSIVEVGRARFILSSGDGDKNCRLISNLNKVFYSAEYPNAGSLISSANESAFKTKTQRLSLIHTCMNTSTMMGLLGTFFGLSVTVASVVVLLDKSGLGGGGGNSSEILDVIVNIMKSLSAPLRGMNIAFVASIYGVVSAILLGVQTIMCRSAYNSLFYCLREMSIEYLKRNDEQIDLNNNKVNTGRIIAKGINSILEQVINLNNTTDKQYNITAEVLSGIDMNMSRINSCLSSINDVLVILSQEQVILKSGIDSAKKMISEGICLQMKNHQEYSNKCNDILKGNLSIAAEIDSISGQQEKKHLEHLDMLKENATENKMYADILLKEMESSHSTFYPLFEKLIEMHKALTSKVTK
ncbi:hypothetical protein KZG16_003321 [Salmonella enterica]|nr:hypothetical protein [Salmonella enterica]